MFVHVPFGSSAPFVLHVLYVLNVATKQLEEGNTASARDLVDSALDILDEGVRSGWYSASDIESLKRFIMTKAAEEGLHEPLGNGEQHIGKQLDAIQIIVSMLIFMAISLAVVYFITSKLF